MMMMITTTTSAFSHVKRGSEEARELTWTWTSMLYLAYSTERDLENWST